MFNNKQVIALIPARGGSKGIPRKNIKILSGKHLIGYTIEEALKSKYIDRVIVSSEDSEIIEVSKKYNAEVPFIRPKELAEDYSTTNDVILHALKWFEDNENYVPEYICILQCTSPLRDVNDIDGAIQQLNDSNFDAVISVCESEVNPYWTNIISDDNKLEYFIKEGKNITRRQDLPKIYRINGAIYVIKTSVFKEKLTLEPENTGAYIMDCKHSVDIDEEIDFRFSELLIQSKEK